MAGRAERDSAKREAFIAALEAGYTVSGAVKRARIARATAYSWRAKDEAFAEQWDEALSIGTDVLEDEATRRAVEGVDEAVYYQGQVVGHVRKYSDFLLGLLLKARRPEIYSDKVKAEVTVPDGAALLTDQERAARIAALVAAGTARAKGEDDGPDSD